MKHTRLYAVVLDALEKRDTGVALFSGCSAVFDEEDSPAATVYLTSVEYTGEEPDSDTWQAELRIKIFLSTRVPDSELDLRVKSRIYPVMSNTSVLSDLITSIVASGYDYWHGDDVGLWSSTDLTYIITHET